MTSKHIRTGFYNDFKGHDTILISVDINGLFVIEHTFLLLAQGVPKVDLLSINYLDNKFHVDIKAFNDKENIGLNQIDKGRFEWRLTKTKWSQFREMSTALYRNSASGHQYLDAKTNDMHLNSLQVILSLDEYPLSFWGEHFDANNS